MFQHPFGASRSALRVECAAILMALIPSTAFAQTKDETPAPLAPLKACQDEADPNTRLACYDRVAAELLSASKAGDLRVVDREEVKKTRRSLFGFALPDFGIFGKGDNKDEKAEDKIDVLNTTIKSVSLTRSGGYLLTTAEGAVWEIDSPPQRLLSPKVGQSLEIRNAALSSYFLRVNGQSGVKGVRVR